MQAAPIHAPLESIAAPRLASSGASCGWSTQRPTPIRVASAPWASSSSVMARLPWAAAPRSARTPLGSGFAVWSRMSASASAWPPATACSTGVMSRTSTAGSVAWASPGSAVSIRPSEARSPRKAAVKTSSLAPAAKSSDSTAARRLNRAAHSGVTNITRSNARPVTPTGR